MPLQADDIADIVTTTLKDLGRAKLTNLATSVLNFPGFKQLMTKYRQDFQSGRGIQWNIMNGNSGNARRVGLYDTDSVNVQDVMTTATAPWRHFVASYAFDTHEEAFNRDGGPNASQVVDLVQRRRDDALTAMPELIEGDIWSAPTSSSNNDRIFGVPYWIPWYDNSSASPNGAFLTSTQGDPTGFSAGAGGLSTATVTGWAPWAGKYAAVSKVDLLRKVRRAMSLTNFQAPVQMPEYGGAPDHGLYTNYSVVSAAEELAEAQNDNLGNDLASKDGVVMIRRTPLTHVATLDSRAGNPVYGIDWSRMKFVFLSGFVMKDLVKASGTQRHVVNGFIDTTVQPICYDRRRQFVLAVSDPTVVS